MTSDYIELRPLADELGISVEQALSEADALIENIFRNAKRDVRAIEGLSTGTRSKGQSSIATVSPKLAQMLRDKHKPVGDA